MSLLSYFLLVLHLVIFFFPFILSPHFLFVESTFFYSFYYPSLAAARDLTYMLNKRLQPPDDTLQSDRNLDTYGNSKMHGLKLSAVCCAACQGHALKV